MPAVGQTTAYFSLADVVPAVLNSAGSDAHPLPDAKRGCHPMVEESAVQ